MSSCCGGNCGCGSSCGCGSGCKGCGKYADLSSYTERFSASQPLIIGVAPTNPGGYEEMGTENDGCKCGPDCKCNPCNCK